MKRIISLLLVLALTLSLTGCKSQEVKAVEAMIDAIGEVSLENVSAVSDAVNAYEKLSAEDREQVENYSKLEKIKEEAFIAQYNDLANRLSTVSTHCNAVISGNTTIWENIGGKDFWTYLKNVRIFSIDQPIEKYHETYGEGKINGFISLAAMGLCPEVVPGTASKFGTKMGPDFTEEENKEVIAICVAYNTSYDYIYDNMDTLANEVSAFCRENKDSFENETDTLNEWTIECSLYVDWALEPSGNLSSYKSQAAEYKTSMERFAKTVDAYY